nr:MAG TPA: hypothetical protein [Caudoviricetes sp.]
MSSLLDSRKEPWTLRYGSLKSGAFPRITASSIIAFFLRALLLEKSNTI